MTSSSNALSRRSWLQWLGLAPWSFEAFSQTQSLVIVGKNNYLFAGWGNSPTPDWAGIDATVNRVAEVRRLLQERGVSLVVPLLPDKMCLYEEHLPSDRVPTPEMKTRFSGILDRLRRASVPVVDGLTLFKSVEASGQAAFYRTDQHWAQAGADAVAQATASWIREHVPRLQGQAGTGLPLGALVKERRYGDLADRFLNADQKKALGRETFTVRKASEGGALLGDGPSPVHVTGNSMVQPYFGFPQMLSNALDRPVSLNWKPGDVGFWIVLMDYLESAEFRKSPPQVLVWQLFEPNFHIGPNAKGFWDNTGVMSDEDWSRRLKKAVGVS